MKIFFFSLFASAVFATVNEPLRMEVFSGYRNDRIHWHLQVPGEGGALTYSELYRDVEYWENGLDFKVIHRDLIFYLRGSYATFGKGTIYQRYANLPFTSEQPRFKLNSDGWASDAVGYFAYAVNLTADRVYKVLLTPLIGYSAYFEQLKRSGGTSLSSLPGTFRLVWNGFFLGAGFTVEPGGRLVFNAGWSYHFMHNRVHTAVENSLSGTPVTQSIRTSSGGNKGQTGWLQVDGNLDSYWRLGIGAQIHYFSTRVVDARIRPSNRGDYSEKFKLRWTAVSGWAQVSREF